MSALLTELHALWTEVFGEPPSVTADAKLLSEMLVRHLPPAPPYGEPGKAGPSETSDGEISDGDD